MFYIVNAVELVNAVAYDACIRNKGALTNLTWCSCYFISKRCYTLIEKEIIQRKAHVK
jgi:hypothetical protein